MLYETPALTGWRRLGLALLVLIGMAVPAASALVAVTLRDAIAVAAVFSLWEIWLVALLVDWLEVRTMLPPVTHQPVWWHAALKVLGWGALGLAVCGLLLGVVETPEQRAARSQWRQGAVPQAVVIVPLAEPTLPPVLPPPPAPQPEPVALGPLQGPPVAAAEAYQKAQAAAAAANKPPPPTPPAPGGGGTNTAPKPDTNPPPAPPPASPNDSRCFGKVKVFVTGRGEKMYALPGWPDFLRYGASNWFCSEAEARAAGFTAAPH